MHDRIGSVALAVFLVVFFLGCAEKQVKTVDMDKQTAVEKQAAAAKESGPAQPAGKEAALKPAAEGAGDDMTTGKAGAASKSALKGKYVVKKGDSLWWIAKYKDIYGDAYLWPVIFGANKKLIKNPNRIYPGQTLLIPREGLSMEALKKARKKAGATKPYAPPGGSNPPGC